jgi:hypothetical protein
MKNLLMAVCLTLLLTLQANAGMITVQNVTGTGTYNGDIGLLTDGYFPPESGFWQTNTVYFHGYGPEGTPGDQEYFTFNLGGVVRVDDILLSVDNNDTYYVEYQTGGNWQNLFTISRSYGNVGWGMDTFSTDSAAPSTQYDSRIDFSEVLTSSLRIWADHSSALGDRNFSIGEFQIFGEVAGSNPVPEPTTLFLFGCGLLAVAGINRKQK